MNRIFRSILSLSPVKRGVRYCLSKPANPLYLTLIVHTEKVHDAGIFAKMLELGAELPFRPSACVMTPANPYIKAAMSAEGVSEDEFRARLKKLGGPFEIGLHCHYCAPGTGDRDPGAKTGIERAGFRLTMNEPEEIKKQFRAEYAYLSASVAAPKAYTAGWWFMNDVVASLLEEHRFETDCSIRHGLRDSFGGTHLAPDRLPEKGVPFILPPTRTVVEFPSVFYLHMNWWTVVKELFPLLTCSKGPLFAALPVHDYDLKENSALILENIRFLSGMKNVKFVSLSEMKKLAEATGAVYGAPGFADRPCPLCGGSAETALWREGAHRAVECGACGLIRVNPQPPAAGDIYNETYYRNNYLPQANKRLAFFRDKLSVIEELRPGKGAVLDVGCGVGFFLKAAKERSWETYGLEPSAFASDHARKEFGLNVISGPLENGSFPGSTFDLATLWDVIAHMSDPAGCLRDLNRRLKKDGLLVVATPVRPRPVFRFASFLSRFITSGYYLHIPQQIFHFTPETLEKLLAGAGFRPVRSDFPALPAGADARSFFSGGPGAIAANILHLLADRFHYRDYLVVYAVKEREL